MSRSLRNLILGLGAVCVATTAQAATQIDGKPNKFTRIWRAGIDTGGTRIDDEPSMTEQCYWFIRDNGVGRGTRVYGTKGASRPLQGKLHLGKILDKTPSGRPIQGGIRLIMLDTSDLKDMLFYRLRRAIEGQGAQSAYLHAETGVDYARQITAEEKRINEKGVQEWVVVRKKNHFLDCETICHALADPEFPGGGVNMLARVQEIEGKRKQAEIKRKQTGGGRRDKFERPAWLDR